MLGLTDVIMKNFWESRLICRDTLTGNTYKSLITDHATDLTS